MGTTEAMTGLALDAGKGPRAFDTRQTVLMARFAKSRCVTLATAIGLALALVVIGPSTCPQVVLGLQVSTVFGRGNDIALLVDVTYFSMEADDHIRDIVPDIILGQRDGALACIHGTCQFVGVARGSVLIVLLRMTGRAGLIAYVFRSCLRRLNSY